VDSSDGQLQIGISKAHHGMQATPTMGVIRGHANVVVRSTSEMSRPLSGFCCGREQRPRCDNQTDPVTAPQARSDWPML
jgi:hypothetical protein